MPASARLIALLDDEEDFRKALSRLLKAHGYQVASFATGEELMAEVPTAAFGCVLLDLNMPGMSGFDVLAELEAELQPPPVIVLSANDDPAMVRRARLRSTPSSTSTSGSPRRRSSRRSNARSIAERVSRRSLGRSARLTGPSEMGTTAEQLLQLFWTVISSS